MDNDNIKSESQTLDETEKIVFDADAFNSEEIDEKEYAYTKKKKRPQKRKLTGPMRKAITIICIMMSCYQLWTSITIGINPYELCAGHLLFVLILNFMLWPATLKSPTDRLSIFDWVFVVLSIITVSNSLFRFRIWAKTGYDYSRLDYVLATILIVLVIECTRRAVGKALPIFAIIILIYGKLGYLIQGPLKHAGFSWKRMIGYIAMSTEGIFGQILNVSATYIFLFILFGAFLQASGMTQVFNDLALALAGRSRGGPAKVSVIASGFMGSISGSTVANVVTTGSFTIPLMKKTGYKDYFAGSVEAAASAGGQIMPPVMGSASFLIADSLGIPYLHVIKAALLPAILYYLSIWSMVDFRARKMGIKGLNKESLPELKDILIKRGHLLIPLLGIIYMLCAGYYAVQAALVGILLSVLSSFLRKDTRINLRKLINALESGALSALSVAMACGIIGIIISIVTMTGAVLMAGTAVLKVSGGYLITTLILTMAVSIVLGMGLPTTACYVLTSTIAAPALLKLGVSSLQAHLFVFFFGIMSTLTPPVCTGSFAAAGLAGADPGKTGWTALRLAAAGFIVPYMFVFSPELLLPSGLTIPVIIRIFATSCIGVVALAIALEGYLERALTIFERVISFIAALLLIASSLISDIFGLIIIVLIYMLQIRYRKIKMTVKKV